MIEFSLEKISERIHFGKTRDYFSEVLSSYQNENYRSSVVMLWSVAVCDIIYKLEHLVDLYDDSQAKEILKKVTKVQKQDDKSSAWEITLIDEVYKTTKLIDGAEHENLRYLQKQRHLSAHPVLNQKRELHTPNKETVRSLLRNTLEGLLIKPPFYTQKILNELLSDISENSEALNSRKKVKQYIESRYFSRLTPDVELQLFRSLWKIVFKLEDEKCEKNRLINFQTLEVLASRNKKNIEPAIKKEMDYYNNIASGGTALSYFVYFLSNNSSIYEILNEDIKLKVRHCIDTDAIGKIVGWFIKDSLEHHYRDLLEWIEGDKRPDIDQHKWRFIYEISDSEEWQESVSKLVGAYYSQSRNFDQADSRFRHSLKPNLHLFSLAALEFTIEKSEANRQTYARGAAGQDHKKVKDRILLLDPNFDFKAFPRFSASVEDDDDELE